MDKTELTLTDIALVGVIISTSIQRGAFKADEVEAVGRIYNKIHSWLAENTPAPTDESVEDAPDEPADAEHQTTQG